MDLFVFERAMETKGGYHTHIQCVPVPKDCTSTLRATMMAHSKACGFGLRSIESDLGVSSLLEKDDSYFYAEILTNSHRHRFLYKQPDDGVTSSSIVPLQFAREVLASVLKDPKLAHWKACVLDKDKESEMAGELRKTISPSIMKLGIFAFRLCFKILRKCQNFYIYDSKFLVNILNCGPFFA